MGERISSQTSEWGCVSFLEGRVDWLLDLDDDDDECGGYMKGKTEKNQFHHSHYAATRRIIA